MSSLWLKGMNTIVLIFIITINTIHGTSEHSDESSLIPPEPVVADRASLQQKDVCKSVRALYPQNES